MSRPDPIQYAERLYAAIRAANFSPISFLAFGSAVKDGVDLRRMPRIAAEPFMRVVGEMLDLEDEADAVIVDADVTMATGSVAIPPAAPSTANGATGAEQSATEAMGPEPETAAGSPPENDHTGKR